MGRGSPRDACAALGMPAQVNFGLVLGFSMGSNRFKDF